MWKTKYVIALTLCNIMPCHDGARSISPSVSNVSDMEIPPKDASIRLMAS